MRVANRTLYDGAIINLARASSDMVKMNEIVSTSKNINRLSDDPVGLVAVLDLRTSLSDISQMKRNISMGNSWLTASESALSQLDSILTATKELTVQMTNATTGATERSGNANLIDGYLEQIVNIANSDSGGRYIFSGTNTSTMAFALNSAKTLVTYAGNDTAFSVNIGKDSSIKVGMDGEDIFGENWDNTNIFKTFIDLKTSLETNDISSIQASMTKLDNHMDSVNANISNVAGKTIRLDVKQAIILDLEFSYTERKSEIEDADIAEAILRLKSKELAYSAALNSAAKMMEMTLVNYV